jgi:predicted ester cyclase
MSSEDNKALVRRFFEEVLNEKRVDRADELVAPDYLDHAAVPGQAPGLEGAKQRWAMYFAAIPDLHTTIDDMVAEGDRVVVRYTGEGTQKGELLGIPPTGSASGPAASASTAWPRGRSRRTGSRTICWA